MALDAQVCSAMPRDLAPMLATRVAAPFDDPAWSWEPKLDGFRVLAFVGRGRVRLRWRNGYAFTRLFGRIADALAHLPSTILDGEVVLLDDQGRPSFEGLQDVMEGRQVRGMLRYMAFDCLHAGGALLTDTPVEGRRDALHSLLRRTDHERVQAVEAFSGNQGTALFKEAAALGLEGVVGKRLGSRYLPGARSRDWVKITVRLRDTFQVIGYFARSGGGVGALVVAEQDRRGRLVYAGVVSVFSSLLEESFRQALQRSHRVHCPLAEVPLIRDRFGELPRDVAPRWVVPGLAVEVEYRQRTRDGLRHASLKGLRFLEPGGLM